MKMTKIITIIVMVAVIIGISPITASTGFPSSHVSESELVISPEQLIGVWQTADFDDRHSYLGIYIESVFEIYFTYEHNALVRRSGLVPGGVRTTTSHFIYEITADGLELTPVTESPLYTTEIWLADDGLYLSIYHPWRSYNELYFLQKTSDEVPFGFTNADMHEIQKRIDQILFEVRNHAQRFADALNLPIIETEFHGNHVPRYRGLGFQIEDIDFTIALDFANWQERWPDGGGDRIRIRRGFGGPFFDRLGATGGGFSLYHSPFDNVPEEWLEVFASLDALEANASNITEYEQAIMHFHISPEFGPYGSITWEVMDREKLILPPSSEGFPVAFVIGATVWNQHGERLAGDINWYMEGYATGDRHQQSRHGNSTEIIYIGSDESYRVITVTAVFAENPAIYKSFEITVDPKLPVLIIGEPEGRFAENTPDGTLRLPIMVRNMPDGFYNAAVWDVPQGVTVSGWYSSTLPEQYWNSTYFGALIITNGRGVISLNHDGTLYAGRRTITIGVWGGAAFPVLTAEYRFTLGQERHV